MNLYSNPIGRAEFVLHDRNGKVLAKMSGKQQQIEEGSGYPHYEIIVVNGVKDVIEYRRMEPVFYVPDKNTSK